MVDQKGKALIFKCQPIWPVACVQEMDFAFHLQLILNLKPQKMTQEEYDKLIWENRPHDVLNQGWDQYSAVDYASTFLSKILTTKSKFLTIVDGAKLFVPFPKTGTDEVTIHLNGDPIRVISYSFPEDVKASENKNLVHPEEDQICMFSEINQKEEISLYFKFGRGFREFLRPHFNDGEISRLEKTVRKRSFSDYQKAFGKGVSHRSKLEFVFKELGLNYKGIREAYDALKFKPEELSIRPGNLFENVSADDAPTCDDNFEKEFSEFKGKLSFGTATDLDAELAFFRSEDHLDGDLGAYDNGYQGEFGFDHYDENVDGTAKLAVKYFPKVEEIGENYRAPFLSLWAPKSKLGKSIPLVNGFNPRTKATIWMKVIRDESKDPDKDSGTIYFDTGSSSVKINGLKTGTFKDGSSVDKEFKKDDKYSFEVECTDVFKEFIHIVFREGSASGKVIGILHVIPNYKLYTTNLRFVDVRFSGTERGLKTVKGKHKEADRLEKFCNANSFNQMFIHTKVLDGSEKLWLDNKWQNSAHLDTDSQYYVPKSLQRTFFNEVVNEYNKQYALNTGPEDERIQSEINNIIDQTDRYPSKELKKKKKEATKAAKKLAKLVKRKFFGKYKKEEYRIAKLSKDLDIQLAQDEYEEAIVPYRNLLWLEVKGKLDKDPKYGPFYESVHELMMKGEQIAIFSRGGRPDLSNMLLVFMIPGIAAITDDVQHGSGVAGITHTGVGNVQMFNLALEDKTSRKEELIVHEIGHAFGLPHPFEQNVDSFDDDHEFDQKLKEFKDQKDKAIAELEKPEEAEDGAIPLIDMVAFYDGKGRLYERAANQAFIRNGQFRYIDHLMTVNEMNEDIQDELEAMQGISSDGREEVKKQTKEEIEAEYNRKVKELGEKRSRIYEEVLDLDEGNSKENYMDYGEFQRKSFWYWQLVKMHCSGAPLKIHEIKK